MSKIAGGCLCGSVRYTSEAEPALVAVCHCATCQKYTGSAFSLNVGVPSELGDHHRREPCDLRGPLRRKRQAFLSDLLLEVRLTHLGARRCLFRPDLPQGGDAG